MPLPNAHPAIRPFRRDDRDQLTRLINAHIGAVAPGWAVSPNTVLAQIERDPGEFVVDPWVTERVTLVAVERDRVVAGAHLCRYASDDRASEDYRGVGEIKWLVCWPASSEAGHALAAACTTQLDAWQVTRRYAEITLPTPVTYGLPDCWPHLRSVLIEAGFKQTGNVEIIFVADLADLPHPGPPPVPGLSVRREVAESASRFVAMQADEVVGFYHLETDLTGGGIRSRLEGWAGVWELHVAEPWRRRGIGTWLVGHGADWLRLGRIDRLIDQTWTTETDGIDFLTHLGFHELVRTERGWERSVDV